MAHPIENIMRTTLENIKDMIDVNTVVGSPMQSVDGTMIIPVSRVSFGFVAGGGEYGAQSAQPVEKAAAGEAYPFAGGTGAGISIIPIAFLVVSHNGTVKVLPADHNTAVDRLIDLAPQLFSEIRDFFTDEKEKNAGNKSKSGSERRYTRHIDVNGPSDVRTHNPEPGGPGSPFHSMNDEL